MTQESDGAETLTAARADARVATLKIYLAGAQASEASPLGPTLAQAGVAPQKFCTAFNEKTRDRAGELVVALVTPKPWNQFELHLVPARGGDARPSEEIEALFDAQLERAEKERDFQFQWAPGDVKNCRVKARIVQGAVTGAGEIIRLWMLLQWGNRALVADADGFFGVAELRHGVYRFDIMFDDVAKALDQL